MTEQFVRKMEEGVKLLGIQLSEKQLEQFYDYFQFLVEKNKVMNLTAITEFEDVVEKHFLDSISLCQVMDLKKSLTLLDLGTGAGFPGIPLKIMFPELKITLADSLNKRLLFLNEVMEALNLKDIETVHGRAEELSKRKDYRESFDLCVSRAVANLSTLSEYCLPFIHTSGKFISYKSGEVEDGRVTFLGDDEAICRANVFLRTAERILLRAGSFRAGRRDRGCNSLYTAG